MRCKDCARESDDCVVLSEYVTVCRGCYQEMCDAWADEMSAKYSNPAGYCPTPRELHQRIAAMRRQIGNKPREVTATTINEPFRIERLFRKGSNTRTI